MGLLEWLGLKLTLEEEHSANPDLCFKTLHWSKQSGVDEWWLHCAACHATLIETYRDRQTGQLKFRYSSHWRLLKGKIPNDYAPYEERLKQLFYEKFPDADEPNAEYAALAQAAVAERIAQYEREDEVRRQENLAKPHCPTCGSTDVQPISTVKRVASTAVMGLASSTIGKSYECKKCGYKW